MTIIRLAVLTSLSLLFSACSNHRGAQPIVVHVLRDPAATEIDSALLAVGAKQLRTSHGQPIMIATIEFKSYAEGLEALGRVSHPELVFFNSPEDLEKAKIGVRPQDAVQVSTSRCYLVVPSWVSGRQRETAELVLAELRRELVKTHAPSSGASH